MATDLTSARWVLELSRETLVRDVGVVTLSRAEGYAASDQVRTLAAGRRGQLVATVNGSGRGLYQTVVEPDRGTADTGWFGRCSCPVAVDCKHAVAVMLVAARRLRELGADTSRQDWEHALAAVVRAPSPGAGGPHGDGEQEPTHRLGLELGLPDGPDAWDQRARVVVRPVRRSLRGGGRWARSGVTWRDLSSPWASPGVDPVHRAAVSQLHTAAQSLSYRHFSATELSLGDMGALAWPVLQRCRDVGVELVAGTGLTAVELGRGTVDVVLDLARAEDGHLSLAPRLVHDDGPVDDEGRDGRDGHDGAGRLLVLGRPAHGVVRVDREGRLQLWPVRTSIPEPLVPLVERDTPVQVPVEDVERFRTLYYPHLARAVPVRSGDGSAEDLEPARPVLLLDLTPGPEHALDLAWSFLYRGRDTSTSGGPEDPEAGTGGGVVVPLRRSHEDGPRDIRTEDRLLAEVGELLAAMPALVDPWVVPPRPEPRTLSGRDTALFVSVVLPALQDHDEVLVRLHGELPGYAEAQDAPVVTFGTSEVGSDDDGPQDWFDLHVTVTVDGEPVPFEELFAALVRGDAVMMLPSGTWFALDTPELQRLRRLIEEARALTDVERPDAVRLTRYQAGLWEELVELGVVGEQAQRWSDSVDALRRLGDADRGTAQVPQALDATLRDYQLQGFRWLSILWDARLGGILADDMGLGKTVQVLATVLRGEERGDLAEGPVLVVAPTSVVATWESEARRFAPGLRTAAVTATRRRRGAALAEAVGSADLVITSYTLLRLEAAEYRALPWSGVVLDEAQFVKNHRSVTYRAVRELGSPRTFVLTGTPLENTVMDLWSMTSLAAPGLFGGPESFTEHFRRPIEQERSASALDRLRRRVRPFLLRRTKGEVATELPERVEQVLPVPLHPSHQKVYDRHLQRERQRVLGLLQDLDRNRMAVFRALTMLRQLALDPGLVDEEHVGLATSAKISVLVDQVRELAAEGHRALVFSSFTGYLGLVREALTSAGISCSYLDGRTRDRPARIAAFREGQDPVFLISLKAGGFGLTLTEADYVFVLDPWWNPAAEAQAVDRAHRIGQTRPVNVYRLVSTGTIEEKVVALQERKRDLFRTVVDAGEFRSGTITAEDIRGLLDG
ncbi:SNF2-related protein [Ornithinimicrobium sp. W1665]|uniref:DEAD/DEAH box helicase n=2 Tax=Ornithinimicrobium sp. W1665 TaxID=3416666 RepID=UPI003CF88666